MCPIWCVTCVCSRTRYAKRSPVYIHQTCCRNDKSRARQSWTINRVVGRLVAIGLFVLFAQDFLERLSHVVWLLFWSIVTLQVFHYGGKKGNENIQLTGVGGSTIPTKQVKTQKHSSERRGLPIQCSSYGDRFSVLPLEYFHWISNFTPRGPQP